MNGYAPVSTPVHQFPSTVNGDPAALSYPGETDWGDFPGHVEQASLLVLAEPRAGFFEKKDMAAIASALGLRLLDQLSLSAAEDRLAHIVDVDAVLVRCTGREAGLDLLLARLDTMACARDMALIVIVDFDGLDDVHAIMSAPGATLLCRPELEEVLAALALVPNRNGERARLHDIGRDGSDARFEKLSDELGRLSRTIEALVQNRAAGYSPASQDEGAVLFRSPDRNFTAFPGLEERRENSLNASQVRAVLRSRRLRDDILAPDLFADPAWDILLDLMAARLEKARVSVSSLCIAAAVPPTTALRWIRQLTERGLLERQADPNDGRRVFIGLSEAGAKAVGRWFEESRTHLLHAFRQEGDGKGSPK